MKKLILLLTIAGTMWFSACGSDSSKEAKELLQRILNLVGIPQSIVVNICQDENKNGFCESAELQAKVTIDSRDDIDQVWSKITEDVKNRYFLETYNPSIPLLLELRDSTTVFYDAGAFTLSFDGLEKKQNEKELSILESMIDAEYLTTEDVQNARVMSDVDKFYEMLLRDLEININKLREVGLTATQTMNANIKEMATELLSNGIRDLVPNAMNACNGDETCINNVLNPLSTELLITDAEAEAIKQEQDSSNSNESNNGDTQEIAGIKWLKTEPDGYFTWQEANEWCSSQGYRLPHLQELTAVWDANGGQISPEGFKKDTFYWALEEGNGEHEAHLACAMDYDCSETTDENERRWRDDFNGHPKCVIDN